MREEADGSPSQVLNLFPSRNMQLSSILQEAMDIADEIRHLTIDEETESYGDYSSSS